MTITKHTLIYRNTKKKVKHVVLRSDLHNNTDRNKHKEVVKSSLVQILFPKRPNITSHTFKLLFK